jgi:ribonuclease HI
MRQVNIYTDGACSGNQDENNLGRWDAVLQFGPHEKEI